MIGLGSLSRVGLDFLAALDQAIQFILRVVGVVRIGIS